VVEVKSPMATHTWAATTSISGWLTGSSASSRKMKAWTCPATGCAATFEGIRGKGQNRTQLGDGDRDQPAVYLWRSADRPQAPGEDAHALALRADGRRYLQRSVAPCKQAITDAGITASQIDEVVLVGGSTRIPRVQQMVRELFSKAPNQTVNPDEVVALGAAVQGGVLAER